MVSAVNVYGESAQSTEGNGAYYTRVPDQLVNLQENIAVRTATTDGLTWEDGVNNGGVPIIDYRVNMKVSTDPSFSIIAGSVASTSYTVTSLVLGTTYDFNVEAQNSVGYSPVSDTIQILHALPPSKPQAPTTENVDQDVIIRWVAPASNGATITSYRILIQHADEVTFSEELVNCDGSQQAVVDALQCTIPLSELTDAPFNLVY